MLIAIFRRARRLKAANSAVVEPGRARAAAPSSTQARTQPPPRSFAISPRVVVFGSLAALSTLAGAACESPADAPSESRGGAVSAPAGGASTTNGGTNQSGGSSQRGGTSANGGASPTAGGFANSGASGDGRGGNGSGGGSNTNGAATNGGNANSSAGGARSGGAGGQQNQSQGGSGAGGSATRPEVKPEAQATLVKVDPGTRRQSFEGWGSSICWWGDRVGGWAEDKRNALLDLIVDAKNGLGYNIFRYNIGGGENPAHTHMGAHKGMPGFQPTKGSWDWNADARQQAVLKRLVSTGQNVIVEAFSNSPPYWMTKSGCASGSSDGADNLKDDQYDAFADYLTEVVKHYRDELGISFRTLEPLNEPNANWWKANGGQEGCHFGPTSQQRIIKAVGAQLASKGLTGTTLSASDENSMDDAYNNIRGFDSTSLGYLSQINAHSYAGSKRAELRTLANDQHKRLWQSESGPLSVDLANDTEAAMFMAGRIILDLRELQPNAWIDWQLLDESATWTSFVFDDKKQSFTPNKRFYMHAGFSRFIRPGATFVSIDNADMVAALSADETSLAIVVRNGDESAARKFTFDLTRLATLPASVEVYRTSSTENLARLSPLTPRDWSFTTTVPAASVTTFVLALK